MDEIFISCHQTKMKNYRVRAEYACLENKYSTFIFALMDLSAKNMTMYLTEKAKQCKFFIGIYCDEYGERSITPFGSDVKKISPIEFEFKLAMEHFERENIMLYVKESRSRDPELEAMLSGFTWSTFNTVHEFALRIEQDLKNWHTGQISRKETPQSEENRTVSISVKCSDASGILAQICNSMAILSGNIISAQQTVYQNEVDIKMVFEWEYVEQEGIDKIDQAICNALTSCGPVVKSSADIKIRDDKNIIRQEVKERGHYIVDFFYRLGIVGEIFIIFSRAEVSILESKLERYSPTYEMGRYYIVANFTKTNVDVKSELLKEISEIRRIVRVEENIEKGTWWY